MTLIPDQTNSSAESYCLLQKGMRGDLSISSLTFALDKVTLGKGATVLDFGCGPGFITTKYLAPLAAKTGAKVFAVDVSKEMIGYAEKYNSAPNLYYVTGDITAKNFPLTGLRFNLIVCNLVLEYLPNPGETLIELSRLLKPGGELLVSTIADEQIFKLLKKIKAHKILSEYMREFKIPSWAAGTETTEESYKNLLTKLNLSSKEMKTTRISSTVEGISDFVEMIIAGNGTAGEIPPNVKKEIQELVQTESKAWKAPNEQNVQILTFTVQN